MKTNFLLALSAILFFSITFSSCTKEEEFDKEYRKGNLQTVQSSLQLTCNTCNPTSSNSFSISSQHSFFEPITVGIQCDLTYNPLSGCCYTYTLVHSDTCEEIVISDLDPYVADTEPNSITQLVNLGFYCGEWELTVTDGAGDIFEVLCITVSNYGC